MLDVGATGPFPTAEEVREVVTPAWRTYDDDEAAAARAEAVRLERLRRAIWAKDPAIAVVAAAALKADDVDVVEAERVMELVLPEGVRDGSPVEFGSLRRLVGTNEVPACVVYAARMRATSDARSSIYGNFHRMSRAEMLPFLAWFDRVEEPEVLEHVGELWQPDDRTLRYAPERMGWRAPDDTPAAGDGDLARRAVRDCLEDSTFGLGAPGLWLVREFTPRAGDAPTLLACARKIVETRPKWSHTEYADAWVLLGALGRLGDDASLEFLTGVATGGDTDETTALVAAAAIARRGGPAGCRGDPHSSWSAAVRTGMRGRCWLRSPRGPAPARSVRACSPRRTSSCGTARPAGRAPSSRTPTDWVFGSRPTRSSGSKPRSSAPSPRRRRWRPRPSGSRGCARAVSPRACSSCSRPMPRRRRSWRRSRVLGGTTRSSTRRSRSSSRRNPYARRHCSAVGRPRRRRWKRRRSRAARCSGSGTGRVCRCCCRGCARPGANAARSTPTCRRPRACGCRRSSKRCGRGSRPCPRTTKIGTSCSGPSSSRWGGPTMSGWTSRRTTTCRRSGRPKSWPRCFVATSVPCARPTSIRRSSPGPRNVRSGSGSGGRPRRGTARPGARSGPRCGPRATRGSTTHFEPWLQTLGRDPSTLPHWAEDLDSNCCRISDGLAHDAFEGNYGMPHLYDRHQQGVGGPLSAFVADWMDLAAGDWVWSPHLGRFLPAPE